MEKALKFMGKPLNFILVVSILNFLVLLSLVRLYFRDMVYYGPILQNYMTYLYSWTLGFSLWVFIMSIFMIISTNRRIGEKMIVSKYYRNSVDEQANKWEVIYYTWEKSKKSVKKFSKKKHVLTCDSYDETISKCNELWDKSEKTRQIKIGNISSIVGLAHYPNGDVFSIWHV
jgi:hypothetical protein